MDEFIIPFLVVAFIIALIGNIWWMIEEFYDREQDQ